MSSSNFHLHLDIPTTSLTAGTNIPAPPPSPPKPSPPALASPTPRSASTPLKTAYSSHHIRETSLHEPSPSPSPNPLRSHPTSSHSLGRKFSGSPLSGMPGAYPESPAVPPRTPDDYIGRSYPGDGSFKRVPTQGSSAGSASSPPSKRALSVRKLLSLRALNSAFGRHSSEGRVGTPGSGEGGLAGYARSNGKKSSDNLSMFSFARAESVAGGKTVRKRRSSAFWNRRGSGFFGAPVEEEAVGDERERERDGGGEREREREEGSVSVERQRTPPPTLPEVRTLGRGVREKDGGFLGGGDMFKDIQ
ncbi:MAG: hypothetical protein MMC23_000151 [Stictis urceolatum]|nr:hypothetical protein [Stictis urceolata]